MLKVPLEVGAMVFSFQGGWKLFAVNEDDISGPGSLNR